MYARVISGQLDRIIFMEGDTSALEIAGHVISTENEDILRLNHVVWVRTSSSIIDLECEAHPNTPDVSSRGINDVLVPISALIEEFGLQFRRLDAGWGVIKRRIE